MLQSFEEAHAAASAAPEVWLLRYASDACAASGAVLPPPRWDANPEAGELAIRATYPSEGYRPLEAARSFAREFNEAERREPIGLWAVILAPGVGARGLRVRPVAVAEVAGG